MFRCKRHKINLEFNSWLQETPGAAELISGVAMLEKALFDKLHSSNYHISFSIQLASPLLASLLSDPVFASHWSASFPSASIGSSVY